MVITKGMVEWKGIVELARELVEVGDEMGWENEIGPEALEGWAEFGGKGAGCWGWFGGGGGGSRGCCWLG